MTPCPHVFIAVSLISNYIHSDTVMAYWRHHDTSSLKGAQRGSSYSDQSCFCSFSALSRTVRSLAFRSLSSAATFDGRNSGGGSSITKCLGLRFSSGFGLVI